MMRRAASMKHPQFFIKRFLDRCAAPRKSIRQFGDHFYTPPIYDDLWTEVMRPASTTELWQKKSITKKQTQFITAIETKTPHQEASVIALLLRETLEIPEKTAALITPDRNLARRVAAQMRKWNIAIDDSGGIGLDKSVAGRFFILAARVIAEKFSPPVFLAFLKHPKAKFQMDRAAIRRAIQSMEKFIRQSDGFFYRPDNGIKSYQDFFTTPKLSTDTPMQDLYAKLAAHASDTSAAQTPYDLISRHIAFVEFCCPDIWQGEDGEAAADLFSELLQYCADMPQLSVTDYAELLPHWMAAKTVRGAFDAPSRIKIWGLMEARLQHADRIILAGLNETIWPPQADTDPWMSRPMRKKFGLPSRERRIGQSAHDFVQLASQSSDIILTRAIRDGGEPKLPSRFWVRLRAMLESDQLWDSVCAKGQKYIDLSHHNDSVNMAAAIEPPYPTPPIAARPTRFSATSIEQWMRDPYGFYAKYILHLRGLSPLDRGFENDIRGTLIHAIFEDYIRRYEPHAMADGKNLAREIARRHIDPWWHRADVQNIWWPKLERIVDWFVDIDTQKRADTTQILLEQTGVITTSIGGFDYSIRATADRIDIKSDGSVNIIDYKTGKPPKQKQIELGLSPQLPIESAIIRAGGFSAIGAAAVSGMEYWELSGMGDGGEVIKIGKNIDALTKDAIDGLYRMIEKYQNPSQGYSSEPHGDRFLKNREYRHLSRLMEWGNSEDDAA